MKQGHLKLFQILLWNYAHHFKESWTNFSQNVQQKKKFVKILKMSRAIFKWIASLDNYFLLKISANGCKQASYLAKAFELAGILNYNNGDDGCNGCFDLDTPIILSKEKSSTKFGSVKYPMLLLLFKTVTSLHDGNSAPENGFPVNKLIIGLHTGWYNHSAKDGEGYNFKPWIDINVPITKTFWNL